MDKGRKERCEGPFVDVNTLVSWLVASQMWQNRIVWIQNEVEGRLIPVAWSYCPVTFSCGLWEAFIGRNGRGGNKESLCYKETKLYCKVVSWDLQFSVCGVRSGSLSGSILYNSIRAENSVPIDTSLSIMRYNFTITFISKSKGGSEFQFQGWGSRLNPGREGSSRGPLN